MFWLFCKSWNDFFPFVTAICSASVSDSWYIGCYQLLSENLRDSSENNVTVLGINGNPISCGRQCLDLRQVSSVYPSVRLVCPSVCLSVSPYR